MGKEILKREVVVRKTTKVGNCTSAVVSVQCNVLKPYVGKTVVVIIKPQVVKKKKVTKKIAKKPLKKSK